MSAASKLASIAAYRCRGELNAGAKENPKPLTKHPASILIEAGPGECMAFPALQAPYAGACNLLVPIVVKTRCCNRYALHTLADPRLRAETPVGSQMCCSVLRKISG